MNCIRVTFSDGDSLVTRFNGTLLDARHYYMGNVFNLGGIVDPIEDRLVTAINIMEVK
jgi:hypothetical protein